MRNGGLGESELPKVTCSQHSGGGVGVTLLLLPTSHHPQREDTVRLGGQLPGEWMQPLVPTASA